jgi:hypothetical protein
MGDKRLFTMDCIDEKIKKLDNASVEIDGIPVIGSTLVEISAEKEIETSISDYRTIFGLNKLEKHH